MGIKPRSVASEVIKMEAKAQAGRRSRQLLPAVYLHDGDGGRTSTIKILLETHDSDQSIHESHKRHDVSRWYLSPAGTTAPRLGREVSPKRMMQGSFQEANCATRNQIDQHDGEDQGRFRSS